MEALPPEQQPIAEQVLRGGIPAVRTALHLEREKAEAEGRPAPNTDELIAMAEDLLPRLRAAEWRDRAEAAAADVDNISMRDLRSVVAGADVARDDETRALGATLRDALERRVAKLHTDWAAEVTAQLDAGKPVRALRLAARPPEPSARLDAELSARLADAAGAAMAPETPHDLWMALLVAVAESPVRRAVTPVGLPEDASPDLKRAAHQYSGSIPALAKMLGVAIPPPPAPVAPRRRAAATDSPGRHRTPRRAPTSPRPGGQEGVVEETGAQPTGAASPRPVGEEGVAQQAGPVEAEPEELPEAAGPEAPEEPEGKDAAGEAPAVSVPAAPPQQPDAPQQNAMAPDTGGETA